MAYLGRNSAIGFAEESTWGTAVSRTNWLPVVSCGLQRTVSRLPRADLKGSSGSAMRRGHFDQAEEAGGSVVVLATYDNVGMLLKHGLGSLATTGTGPYTHDYTLAATLPTGLTIEAVRGTSGEAEVFEGCKVSSMTLEVSAGAEMTLSMEIIAETATARATAGTPSYATDQDRVLHHQAGQFSFNGSNYDLQSMSLTVNNSLTRRQLLGSKLTKEPTRSDFQSVEMSVSVEAADALYTALMADTTGDATITFTSGTKSFAFTLHNAYLTEASDTIGDAGIISQSITLVGESDGTDEGLQISVVNDNASGTAN